VAILRAGELIEVGTLAQMRHLSALSVDATFDTTPPDLSRIPGVIAVEVEDNRVRCQVVGSVEPLLGVLAASGVHQLLSREPSLEELFLAHYDDIERTVGRLGAQPASATAAWIGYEFLYLGALLAFAAAGQIAAMRSEEADGHLDHLLARPLDRRAWLAGRLGFGAVFIFAAALATGLAAWAGIASGPGGLGLGPVLEAGLNLVPPALLILGLGTLLLGVAPRLAMPLLYALVLWSFLMEIVGTSITSSQWLLDTALFTHVGPVPATSLDWPAMGIFTGLGLIAALAGLAAFARRDLAAA
jgi:putative exporter of polyketide antibiotics